MNFNSPAENIWYIMGETPSFVQKELDNLYELALKKNLPRVNRTLAGYLDMEYGIEHSGDVNNFILQTFADHLPQIKEITKSNSLNWHPALKVINQWINIQKKNESNPIHVHSGDLSYVFWHKVPYTLEAEKKLVQNADVYPADFTFVYADKNNEFVDMSTSGMLNTRYLIFEQLNIYNDKENTFAIFPAWLAHSVGQFKSSEEFRVTFSGNFSKIIKESPKTEKSIL